MILPEGPSCVTVALSVRSETLATVGGAAALHTLRLPLPPQRICDEGFEEDFVRYIDEARRACVQLRDASKLVEVVMRLSVMSLSRHEIAADMFDGDSTTYPCGSSLASSASDMSSSR